MFTGCIQLAGRDVWQQCDVPIWGGSTAMYLTRISRHILQEIGGNWKSLEGHRTWSTTVGPQNAADEISASTWKIHYTTHLIWSGSMLRDITWVGHMNMTRTNQREWSAGKRYGCGEILTPIGPINQTIHIRHQTYWHSFAWQPLTWRSEKQIKKQNAPALSTQSNFLVI